MYVGGTVISSVEFHGNMSLVIFMSKCPLACRYCHNAELLDDNTQLSFEEIKKEIDDAADFIVFSADFYNVTAGTYRCDGKPVVAFSKIWSASP